MDTWVTSSSSMTPNAVADVRPAYTKKAALLDAAFTRTRAPEAGRPCFGRKLSSITRFEEDRRRTSDNPLSYAFKDNKDNKLTNPGDSPRAATFGRKHCAVTVRAFPGGKHHSRSPQQTGSAWRVGMGVQGA